MPPSRNAVARWASALTLGQPTPIADDFNTTKYFAQAPLRIHYAAVFNGATATQIHNVSPFNWICCLQPEDLAPIKTGAALVTLVESHLTDQLKAAIELQTFNTTIDTDSKAMPDDEAELPLIGEDE